MHKKNFNAPDDTMSPPNAKMDIVKLNYIKLMRSTFEPGWKWSVDIGSQAGTKTCGLHHLFYISSGNMKVVMDDGAELEVGPDDVADIPPGHDAWVLGDEPVVGIDLGSLVFDNPM